jgi:peptidoglycan/xylan/chitin deacetylase (PgdA/CDA1 family)
MPIPVLLYHKIDKPAPDARVRGGYMPLGRFEKQMVYLKRQGFVFYTASKLVEHYREHGSFPPNALALTFDDGWKDNYTNAFPVLRRLQIPATIFIIPSCTGMVSAKAQAEGESGRAHLSREEILEMADQGIEFGSHSMNHRLLHEISPAEVRFEIEESKRQIEGMLQRPCQVFAYPAGFFTDEARRIVEETGHIAAFSTVYGPAEDHPDLYALNRIEILRRDRFLFQFARKVKPLRS